MKILVFWHAAVIIVALSLALAFSTIAASTTQTLSCAPGDVCTIMLGPGHWIIRTPAGQTVDQEETDNETRYRIETPRPGPK